MSLFRAVAVFFFCLSGWAEPELFQNPALRPNQPLLHRVRATSAEKWSTGILPHLGDRNEVQRRWPHTSLWGAIWTFSESDFRTMSGPPPDPKDILVKFDVDPRYGFFNPHDSKHEAAWKSWISTQADLPNSFSPDHIETLRKYDLPWHSEFYRQNQIAGVVDGVGGLGPGTPWTLVNFDGVKEVQVTAGGKTTTYSWGCGGEFEKLIRP